MKVKIVLEGRLKNLYPNGIDLVASTAREAFTLLMNFPGFRKEDKVRHFVRVPEVSCIAALDVPLDSEVLTLVPIVAGSGGGGGNGLRQIIIGALVIAMAVFAPELFGVAAHGFFQTFLFNVGVSLVLGGILNYYNRSPKADPTAGDKRSRFISGTKNTVSAGTPIILIYGGPIKVGGQILSFDIDAENYVPD